MYSFSFSNLCRWWHSMDLCQLEILVQPQTSVHQIRFGTKWPGFQLHRLQNGKGIIEFNSISTQTFKNRNRFNEILGFWRFIRRFKKGNQELHSTWPERRLLLNLHKKSQIRSSFYGFIFKWWSKIGLSETSRWSNYRKVLPKVINFLPPAFLLSSNLGLTSSSSNLYCSQIGHALIKCTILNEH